MTRRGILAVAVLLLWVVLGPIGMAFDSCAAMMALCDGGPCGVVAAVTEARPTVTAPTVVVVSLAQSMPAVLPVVAVRAPEPPPKLFRLSA
jgi:hypothetical protein